ncbi:MAG: TonB-dependent receptor [Sphingomonadaceae bacterium]
MIYIRSILAPVSLLLAALPAFAQDSDRGYNTPETLVPGAVSGFGIEDFDRRALRDSADIWTFVPNAAAHLAPGLGSATDITLRGLGSGTALTGREAAVTTVIDGVPLPGVNANRFGLFDFDRIRVRRGSQGVDGGRGALAGTVDVTLAKPGDRITGYVESGYGADKHWALRGSVDVPLAPVLAVKLSGYRADGRGYARNLTTGNRLNDSDAAGLRLGAEFRPADRLTWNAAVAWMRSDAENLYNGDCSGLAACKSRFSTTGMLVERRNGIRQYPGTDLRGSKGAQTLENRADLLLVTSDLTWSGNNHALSLITGYSRLDEQYGLDFADGRPLTEWAAGPRGFINGGTTILADNRRTQFTQEVRLSGSFGPIGYRVGGFFLDGDYDLDMADLLTPASGITQVLTDRQLRLKEEELAGYGLLTAAPGGGLTLSAGVRYSDEEKKLSGGFGPGSLLAAGIPARLKADKWTPHVAIEWQAGDALLAYASARRAWRAGNWNLRALTAAALAPHAPEAGWTYEAGIRTGWFDNRLRVGVTGFRTDINNAQAGWSRVDPATGALLIGTDNVGEFRNTGAELELSATPVNGVDLRAMLGWQDAEYRTPATSGPALYDPAHAPDWTASAGGSWDIHWKSGESFITPSVDVAWRSSMTTDPGRTSPSRWLVNASLALTTDDGIWMVAAECNNCLDSTTESTSLGGLDYLAGPRIWLLKARRKF